MEELSFLEPPPPKWSVRTLVHTGRGRFCLVETAPVPEPYGGRASLCTCNNDGMEELLRVTMFRVKHGKNGELVVVPCRPGRSYLVPNYSADSEGTPAFWM